MDVKSTMDLFKRNLFDRYVYGDVYPYVGGRRGDNKYYESNENAVADEELNAFAQQIIKLSIFSNLDLDIAHDQEKRKSHLQQMLQIVCDELGKDSQLAMDIKGEITNQEQNADPLPEDSFLDSMLRIKGVFASDIEHDYALDYDS